MIFTANYQVRWHDTDANRRMTPSHLLMDMEETSNRHLAAAGLSFDDLRDRRGLAFLLSRMTVRIYRPLTVGDQIEIDTWVCESRGLSFVRCYRVRLGDVCVAEAYSVWALMELAAQRLLPVSEFPYDIELEAPLDATFSARVRYPALQIMEVVGTRRIVYSDLDYNWHMNNTHYPNMLCDFVSDIHQKRVTGFSLSFLHEAAFGHELTVHRGEREEGSYFRMTDTDGRVCLEAVVYTEAADESREERGEGI